MMKMQKKNSIYLHTYVMLYIPEQILTNVE